MKKNSDAAAVPTETDSSAIFVGGISMKNTEKGRINRMAKSTCDIQKKLKILEKLVSLGVATEEDMKKLTPGGLLKDNTLSFADLSLVYEMQESVKANKLFSFLAKSDE